MHTLINTHICPYGKSLLIWVWLQIELFYNGRWRMLTILRPELFISINKSKQTTVSPRTADVQYTNHKELYLYTPNSYIGSLIPYRSPCTGSHIPDKMSGIRGSRVRGSGVWGKFCPVYGDSVYRDPVECLVYRTFICPVYGDWCLPDVLCTRTHCMTVRVFRQQQ